MYRIWILMAVLAVAGCHRSVSTPATTTAASEIDPHYGHLLHAQRKLPTVKVWLGSEELVAEVARQPIEIATGMMFRTNLAETEGMLFVFPDAAPRSFYMRNCVIDLSGAYLNPAGEISQIIQMKKGDETPIFSQANNIQFVLETSAGWFERHQIKPGVMVRTEYGSLRETFFGKN